MLNIVLCEPRIPQNTGNIGRLCLALNARLHLIYPLGFVLNDKELKRAGMDYFNEIELVKWESLDAFLKAQNLGKSRESHLDLHKNSQDLYELHLDSHQNLHNLSDLQNPKNLHESRYFFLTTKATKSHFEAHFSDECFLIFGREDAGLPKWLLDAHPSQCYKIPMQNNARSLNLSNAVSIVAYEAVRQIQFL